MVALLISHRVTCLGSYNHLDGEIVKPKNQLYGCTKCVVFPPKSTISLPSFAHLNMLPSRFEALPAPMALILFASMEER